MVGRQNFNVTEGFDFSPFTKNFFTNLLFSKSATITLPFRSSLMADVNSAMKPRKSAEMCATRTEFLFCLLKIPMLLMFTFSFPSFSTVVVA